MISNSSGTAPGSAGSKDSHDVSETTGCSIGAVNAANSNGAVKATKSNGAAKATKSNGTVEATKSKAAVEVTQSTQVTKETPHEEINESGEDDPAIICNNGASNREYFKFRS